MPREPSTVVQLRRSSITVLRELVSKHGQSGLARLISAAVHEYPVFKGIPPVRQSNIQIWLDTKRRAPGIPDQYILPIEYATGVSREHLRPDLYTVSKRPAKKGNA